MGMKNQKFPVQEAVGPSPIKLDVNEADIDLKFLPRVPMFKEYHQQVKRLRQKVRESGGESQRDPGSGGESQREAQQQLETLLMFEPNMTPRERAIALYTMDVFINVCSGK